MIEKLTPEQEKRLEEFRDEWVEFGIQPHNCDREATEEIMASFYERLGFDVPPMVWRDSPKACIDYIYGETDYVEPQCYPFFLGRSSSFWVARHIFAREIGVVYDPESNLLMDEWNKLIKSAHIIWTFDEYCVLSEGPTSIHWDDWEGENGIRRLHNATGPAIEYKDGTGIYVYHGIRVPAEVITEPISVEQIKNEDNSEVRRVMLDIFGWERYIGESGMMPVHEDRFGRLFKYNDELGERLMVLVVNSSPEPDGTYKKYVLRVPSRYRNSNGEVVDIDWPIETAHAAVAATFGKHPDEYFPGAES